MGTCNKLLLKLATKILVCIKHFLFKNEIIYNEWYNILFCLHLNGEYTTFLLQVLLLKNNAIHKMIGEMYKIPSKWKTIFTLNSQTSKKGKFWRYTICGIQQLILWPLTMPKVFAGKQTKQSLWLLATLWSVIFIP